MSKVKYRFDPDSLSYKRVKPTTGRRLMKFLIYGVGTILIFIAYYLVFSPIIDLPEEVGLRRQVNELEAYYKDFNNQLNKIETDIMDMQQRDNNIYRTIFGTDPIDKSVREAGFGGSNKYQELKKLNSADIVINTAKRLDIILSKVSVQSNSYNELISMAQKKEEMTSSIPAIQPIANKDLTRVGSFFGYRIHPIYKISKFHEGMDFTSAVGTNVYATGDGVVEELEKSERGYGNKILINHGYGYKTLYAHLNSFKVKQGQKVHRGDIIGSVGNTGLSTAPHLHYEVYLHGNKINPINFYFNDLTAEEYDKMIALASKPGGQSFD